MTQSMVNTTQATKPPVQQDDVDWNGSTSPLRAALSSYEMSAMSTVHVHDMRGVRWADGARVK